ncbi:MAG: 2-phosphosulfolactate phosphatase [Planctomycetota bacterium]|nr:2-phosphosulfolactate phosphatase [Planctomycetota bacterium]
MRVEVALTQSLVPEVLAPGTAVVVIDVVRATSVVCCALAAGARGVTPVAGVDESRELAGRTGALLVGERGGLPPDGFDLGNSPGDFTTEICEGREVVLTTTNGTAAVARCQGAARLLGACLLNAEATARSLVDQAHDDVLLVCAGSGGHVAMDDVAAAGCIGGSLALLGGAEPGDGMRVAAAVFDTWKHDLQGLLRRSLSGRKLADVGLATDLLDCARVDTIPVVAELDEAGVFRRAGS